MIAGADNVATELLELFGEKNFPLPSAMIQRRNQVKKEAFQELFFQFNKTIPDLKTYHGCRLIACDGTRLNLPYNPTDKSTLVNNIKGRKGFNQTHLNALYDILNDIFIDVEVQGMREMDEKGAFCRFLNKHSQSNDKFIFIADRGYASFNSYAHAINNNQLFLIRMKERGTAKSTHKYVFNHTQMQKFVRLYLIGKIEKLESLVNRFLVPVRPGRKFKRIIRRQSAEPLSYR